MKSNEYNPIAGHVSKREYASMFYFLSLCGNVFFQTYVTEFIFVLSALAFVLLFYSKSSIRINVSKQQRKCITWMIEVFLLLFVLQYMVFGWNTVPGIINHISKFIVGAGYIAYMGKRFRIVFFRTMYLICLIALPLWLVQQVLGGMPGLDWGMGKTIWLYGYRANDDIVRNCGFFWEPGAFGGYISLLTLLFFDDLKELFLSSKKKCIIILLALLSTQSTGGYMSFGCIVLCYLAFSMKSKTKYILLPVVAAGALYTYDKLDFLSEKIEGQNENATELEWGEYSSTRMGTLMFDLYYVAKHPLIGNGLHERTRLADHQMLSEMLKNGEAQGAGNGFSDTLAKWGLIYVLAFAWLFFRNNKDVSNLKKSVFLVLVCIILQGEAFMNYPLFLGIPLFHMTSTNKKRMVA